MTKTLRILTVFLALLTLTLVFVGCQEDFDPTDFWEISSIREDTSFGNGANTLSITVTMGEKSILLTIKTDAATVKDALLEHELIHGEQQAIGYMMTTLIGISAEYETDGAYWAYMQNGEYMMTGIDSTPITGDAAYEFVYTLAG